MFKDSSKTDGSTGHVAATDATYMLCYDFYTRGGGTKRAKRNSVTESDTPEPRSAPTIGETWAKCEMTLVK